MNQICSWKMIIIIGIIMIMIGFKVYCVDVSTMMMMTTMMILMVLMMMMLMLMLMMKGSREFLLEIRIGFKVSTHPAPVTA